jgi:hypothetical protein
MAMKFRTTVQFWMLAPLVPHPHKKSPILRVQITTLAPRYPHTESPDSHDDGKKWEVVCGARSIRLSLC